MKKTQSNSSDIDSTPYYERQLITIVPDEVKDAEEKAKLELEKSKDEKKLKSTDYLDIVTNILKKSPNPQMMLSGFLLQFGTELFKTIKDLYKKGIEVFTVSSSESSSLLFPPGHPRRKSLYVGHPANPNVYFPFADFHRLMFESKFSEAVILLMSLGAETLNVERLEGWGYEMSSQVVVPIQMEKAGVEVSGKIEKERGLMFSASLQPNHSPVIPDNLVWYNYEPTWKMIVDGRTKYGLKEFSMNVTYKDDFGIGVKLKGEIEKAGFEIGTNFQGHNETVWNINGKFADVEENQK